jgi:hypothetical protein
VPYVKLSLYAQEPSIPPFPLFLLLFAECCDSAHIAHKSALDWEAAITLRVWGNTGGTCVCYQMACGPDTYMHSPDWANYLH